MKTIPLTQGYEALVDDADYEALSQFSWHAHIKKGSKIVYARRTICKPDGSFTGQMMHKFLFPDVPMIDHQDGNGANNQRNNLRPATPTQNRQGFRNKSRKATSQFRGVKWHKRDLVWEATIHVANKDIYLGRFRDEILAAKAYDAAAIKYFGYFASPNFKTA